MSSPFNAAICRTFNAPLSIEPVTLSAPEAQFVEVTLGAVAICHSDISYADGGWGGTLPLVLGHEAAGKVTGLGPDTDGFELGDRVVVTLIRSCGTCPSCADAAPTQCETPRGNPSVMHDADGNVVATAMNCGAFAQKVVVHRSQIVKIPQAMPYDVASLVACGVITGIGAAVNAAQIRPGEDVVVIGAGGVGLNAIQGARLAGARRIVAVDMHAEKLNDAKEFGATDGVLAGPDAAAAVAQTLGRAADVVMVSVGLGKVYSDAPNFMGPRGRMVMLGMPHTGDLSEYDASNVAAYGQGFIGTKMGNIVPARDIPWIMDLYLQGRLNLDALISGRWRFDQINEAIADTKTGKARRNVIVFEGVS